MKSKLTQAQIDLEVTRIQSWLADSGGTIRTERPIAKAFLLANSFFRKGNYYHPKAKHVGLGVYDLTIECSL